MTYRVIKTDEEGNETIVASNIKSHDKAITIRNGAYSKCKNEDCYFDIEEENK